jgi:hypothetical protein
MAHEVKYRYRAYMPIDGTRKIVHLEALTPGLTYRFISFEHSPHGLCVINVRYAPDDALHLEVKKTDEATIKNMLASHNHHDEYHIEEIEIIVGEPVHVRRGSYPHPNPFTDEPVGNRWDKIGR